MRKTVGLVIQGALTSVGRTGDKLHQTPEELKRTGGVVEYDCRQNIQNIIDNYGHLFDKIVVSVFDNQLRPSDAWPGAEIVSCPDPGGVKQVGHYKDNNKVRQFLSTLNGVREMERAGIEYVVKTRTDTYLDFEKLISSFFKNDTSKIGSTIVHPPTFPLHDLYFIAKTENLRKFCESVLAFNHFEFISSVHRDIILKHAYAEYCDRIGVPPWAYFSVFPPDGLCRETRKIFGYMFENIYFMLNEEVWRSTLWRGTHFAHDHFESLIGRHSSRHYNLPAFITIDGERHFAFLAQEEGRLAKVTDKPLIIVAHRLWKLWKYIRQVAQIIKSRYCSMLG